MNYRIAPEAQQDLADIWHFIALDNLTAADRVLDSIKSGFSQIGSRPGAGRAREELAPGLRSFVVRKYRRYLIFYRPYPDIVEIVRVLDGSRDLKRLFKRG
jgi:toxin ParE1/3/4